jgi:Tfp pilus assembly protein FimT
VKRARAVTLVELVLVIVLTLILASVAIGGLKGVQTWRAAAATRRVQADLTYARDLAMISSRRTLCTFDSSAGSYEIRQEAAPTHGLIIGSLVQHPLTGQPWSVLLADLGGAIAIDAVSGVSDESLGFGGDGMPLDASGQPVTGNVTVELSNGAEIVIHRGSGLNEVVWP